MSMHLVVVESPAKAKTIKRYLGPGFEVMASYGHVRDLLPKEGAVDPDNGFAMRYDLIEKNTKHVESITKAMQKADVLYLATDLDREGEAISWHLVEVLNERKVLDAKPIYRVVFHEITKRAIEEAVQNPRQISMDLVNAQQARRALDYLVGFNLSPLLWRKIRTGLSAGRVQSPALRLIVEREEEIEAFKIQEYWTIDARASREDEAFTARLNEYQGEKVKQFTFTNAEEAEHAKKALLGAAAGKLTVSRVEKKQRKRQPAPPFITASLQQEAIRKLGFTAQKTMRVAQQLYEGIEIEGGSAGLITYMRTDSVNLAQEALSEIRGYVAERFGIHLLPAKPRFYKTKSKNAQEAHEAIRPTSVSRTPEQLKAFLSDDQRKLYELVWKRTVACQMIDALFDTVTADLACGQDSSFRATGSRIADPGFMTVYQEGKDDSKTDEDAEAMLPALKEGETLTLAEIIAEQHFTEPPPRYTEASLVKSLEEFGIGRPSTYASIISTLQQRKYVVLEKKRFKPTDVGRVVNKFLTEHFTDYVDYDFTAKLEDELDAISRGEKVWVPLMDDFWKKFKQLVDLKAETVTRREVTQELLDEACPKCEKPLVSRLGRHGRFVGCTGYPECDYTRNLNDKEGTESTENPAETVEGRVCPECQSPLVSRQGRYGKFIGCSAYPKCRYIESKNKPEDTGVACPQCRHGSLVKRKSRFGKFFYSCSTYPTCKYAVWNEPVKTACPSCHWPILTLKTTKRHGTERVCPQKECGYAEPCEPTPEDVKEVSLAS
jgi:DNA topoisomerase-1